mmetsp:Transcript_30554/g.70460  ORF Transcript_30554/g.70460 Transcript_30554/m.70460 type:complete len:266 (+) Transcript_30554:667-1464(+)
MPERDSDWEMPSFGLRSGALAGRGTRRVIENEIESVALPGCSLELVDHLEQAQEELCTVPVEVVGNFPLISLSAQYRANPIQHRPPTVLQPDQEIVVENSLSLSLCHTHSLLDRDRGDSARGRRLCTRPVQLLLEPNCGDDPTEDGCLEDKHKRPDLSSHITRLAACCLSFVLAGATWTRPLLLRLFCCLSKPLSARSLSIWLHCCPTVWTRVPPLEPRSDTRTMEERPAAPQRGDTLVRQCELLTTDNARSRVRDLGLGDLNGR